MDISKLRQKATAGSVVAQSVLGICYLEGIDVEKGYCEAFRLLSSAADRGAPRAMVNLARMYSEGLGIPKDTHRALTLYKVAAESGEFTAQIELGRIFSRGIGVPINVGAAVRWYGAAQAQEGKIERLEDIEEAKTYLRKIAQDKKQDGT